MPETSVHEKRKDIDTKPTPTDVELINQVLHSYFEPRADRNVVMHRSLRSLTVSIAALSARDLKEAASQETDIDVLMEALRRALAKNANHAALSQLQLTTRMQALLKVEGGSIKVGEVQKILGISRQAIARRRGRGREWREKKGTDLFSHLLRSSRPLKFYRPFYFHLDFVPKIRSFAAEFTLERSEGLRTGRQPTVRSPLERPTDQ